MHYQQQEQLPPLIPIRKKKDNLSSTTPQIDDKSKHLQSTQPKTQQRQNNESIQESKITQPIIMNRNNSIQQKEADKSPKQQTQRKMQSFSQKFKQIQQKSGTQKKSTNKRSEEQKKQQNEKSKFLIAQMLNKINVKNISQQLYPITNETIETVIYHMEEQIQAYKVQAQKKENTLMTNPNNQHLKSQIANLEKSIDHCTTIKELYHQKINFRNKIGILQSKIIELRAQNRDLKIKVSRGIQKIENHMHSLPCEKEKELKEELSKCTQELKKQKQMRMSLENNIQEIIMNFKRLYEEADTARLIVTKKLKDIEERQKKIAQFKFQPIGETDQKASNSIKRTPKTQLDEKKSPKPGMTNNPHESQNSTQRFRHSRPQKDQRQRQNDRQRQRTDRQRQRIDRQRFDRQRQRNDRDTQRNSNITFDKQQRKPLSFQQSIKKMRANQNMFSKIYNRG